MSLARARLSSSTSSEESSIGAGACWGDLPEDEDMLELSRVGASPGGAAGQLANSDDEWLSEDDVPVTSNPDLLVLNPSGRRLVPATLLFKLPKTWTLFFDAQRKGKNYNAGIAQIGNITSVQEFWRYWNNINFGFGDRGSLGLFREGIRPVWEDPENKEGGRWIIATNPAVPLDAKKRLDLFTDLALGMIGGHFDGLLDQLNGDGVCGVVYSGAVKGRPKIELWNKKANHDNLVKVDYKIRSLLGLENSDYGVKIEYKSHFGSLKRTMKRAWSSTAAVGGGNAAAAANRDFLAKRCDAEGEQGENEREALLAGAKSFSASAAIASPRQERVRDPADTSAGGVEVDVEPEVDGKDVENGTGGPAAEVEKEIRGGASSGRRLLQKCATVIGTAGTAPAFERPSAFSTSPPSKSKNTTTSTADETASRSPPVGASREDDKTRNYDEDETRGSLPLTPSLLQSVEANKCEHGFAASENGSRAELDTTPGCSSKGESDSPEKTPAVADSPTETASRVKVDRPRISCFDPKRRSSVFSQKSGAGA